MKNAHMLFIFQSTFTSICMRNPRIACKADCVLQHRCGTSTLKNEARFQIPFTTRGPYIQLGQ